MRRTKTTISLIAILSAAMAAPVAHAESADNATAKNWKPLIDARVRAEGVGTETLSDRGIAYTARLRFGVEVKPHSDFSFIAEGEAVGNLNDRFNSTINGQTQFPVVADPEVLELNRAQMTYTGIKGAKVTIGRQRIPLANQRFIGAVNFRQNQQTFDAGRVEARFSENVSGQYIYIDRVHRIFGNQNPAGNWDSNSHVASLSVKKTPIGQVTITSILLDLEDADALSTSTHGVRIHNAYPVGDDGKTRIKYDLAYAHQTDYADNPNDFSEDYYAAEASVSRNGFGLKAGYEHLGGNGSVGFSTPLATLHKFQGYADVFLMTPSGGVEDIYVGVSAGVPNIGPLKKLSFAAIGHDYRSALGNDGLGKEIDLVLTGKVNKNLSVQLKGAVYDGGEMGRPDINRFWAAVNYKM